MTTLYEHYRPKALSQVVGHGKAITTIKRLLTRGWGGRAWWISGVSGIGKTTIAWIIAGHGADDLFIVEYDSGEALKAPDLLSIQDTMCYLATGKGGRSFIINEAHGLQSYTIRSLLGILERIPRHVCFVFTTTMQGQKHLFGSRMDAHPLLSRCTHIELGHANLERPFARYCKAIAEAERLDGKPLGEYIRLAQQCKSNCREMLMRIEAGEML